MAADTTLTLDHAVPDAPAAVVARPKSRTRRLLRGLLRTTIYLLALYCVIRLGWRFSGDNEWKLVSERNGARVWTLKQPGSDLLMVKGSVPVKTSMAGIVAWLRDPQACKDAGCYSNTVEPIGNQLEYEYFRFNMRPPFKPRDFVLRAHFHQIPTTKELWAEYAAAPSRVPLNDCCHRVTSMNTTWRFTPIGKGMVEAEYTMNMDWGGFIPDLLSNVAKPKYMGFQLRRMQGFLDKPQYQTAKYDFIQEPAQ